jgi:hypothetical protein
MERANRNNAEIIIRFTLHCSESQSNGKRVQMEIAQIKNTRNQRLVQSRKSQSKQGGISEAAIS